MKIPEIINLEKKEEKNLCYGFLKILEKSQKSLCLNENNRKYGNFFL